MRLPMEYDALFRMPPRYLADIFHMLGQEMTTNVRISISNRGVDFIKEEADPNLDRGGEGPSDVDKNEDTPVDFIKEEDDLNLDRGDESPADVDENEDSPGVKVNTNHVSHILVNLGKVTVELEDRVREAGVEESFCMVCLHKYINKITSTYPQATDVTMYLGKMSAFIIYTAPYGLKGYLPHPGNHMYHEKEERDAVIRGGFEVNAGDGQGEIAEENKRLNVSPEDGDGKGDEELLPKDGDGKGVEEMVPKDGDGKEVNAEDGEGELAKENEKENEKEKLNPEAGKGAAELVSKDGDGDDAEPK